MTDLCIDCFEELDDGSEDGRCLSCEEGVQDTWPWEMWNDFEELDLSELDDDSDEEE